MIVALSRFKVVSDMALEVRVAFQERPHLVDDVPGFLGMEVFTDDKQASDFYLLTRWTDRESYTAWHASPAHHKSHSGIPKGLKLDPSFTQISILQRIPPTNRRDNLERAVADAAPLIASYLGNASAAHFLLCETDGTIDACNTACAAALKVDADTLLGQPIWDCLVAADAQALRGQLHTGKRVLHEKRLINFVDRDRAPYSVEAHIDIQPGYFVLIGERPLRQEAALQEEMLRLNNELATISRENIRKSRALGKALAELKEAQSQLVQHEKMASLGQMTAGIAHEINNPIAFIAGNHATLMRDFKDLLALINIVGDDLEKIGQSCPSIRDRILAKVDEIDLNYLVEAIPRKIANNEDGLERVKQIVLDLRTFSRLDDDGFKPCDVAQNILASLRFLNPLTQAHGVEIETRLSASPPLVCAPGLLNQAISNIVTNAIQASRKGERVLVSTRSDDNDFVVEVQDHGSGISPEDLPKVFDPFFTTKPVGTGTGMGLGIAFQIVKAHHGEIEIDSEAGKGTTVRIRLPWRMGRPSSTGERDNSVQ